MSIVGNNLEKGKNNLAIGKTVNGYGQTYAQIVTGKREMASV